MNKKIVIKALIVPLLFIQCSKSKPEYTYDPENEPKFHTEEKPGKWGPLSETHIPVVKLEKSNDLLNINVRLNFPQTGNHYAETIVLADHTRKEIDNVKFKSHQPAIADFTLPGNYRSKLYVILKCNLHDMWEIEINPDN